MQMQGLTLDIAGGNLLRLGKDGVILAASHGTRFLCCYLFVLFFRLLVDYRFVVCCSSCLLDILKLPPSVDCPGVNLFVFLFAAFLSRKMNDVEIERQYGRYRNKHITSDYALHLKVSSKHCACQLKDVYVSISETRTSWHGRIWGGGAQVMTQENQVTKI